VPVYANTGKLNSAGTEISTSTGVELQNPGLRVDKIEHGSRGISVNKDGGFSQENYGARTNELQGIWIADMRKEFSYKTFKETDPQLAKITEQARDVTKKEFTGLAIAHAAEKKAKDNFFENSPEVKKLNHPGAKWEISYDHQTKQLYAYENSNADGHTDPAKRVNASPEQSKAYEAAMNARVDAQKAFDGKLDGFLESQGMRKRQEKPSLLTLHEEERGGGLGINHKLSDEARKLGESDMGKALLENATAPKGTGTPVLPPKPAAEKGKGEGR